MGSTLQRSSLDSNRFCLEVYRAHADASTAKDIAKQLLSGHCDVAIVRSPSGDPSLAAEMQRFGLPVIHADTLVYYEADLGTLAPSSLRNTDLLLREAQEGDREALESLVATTFDGYRSHYHANPLFDPEAILDGYKEWGTGFLDRGQGTLWVAERRGRIVAFAACADDAAGVVGEGILYGVAPEAAGGGVYGDLIRHTANNFKARGYSKMRVSTQVWNHAVQKVWAREGFTLRESWDTHHVNAMMGRSGELCYAGPLILDQAKVQGFAELSGDLNPIHVDIDAAHSAGFPGPVAHGVLGAAEISRILGTVAPGAGTVLTQLSLSFLRPMLVDDPLTLEVRYAGRKSTSGAARLVALIHNSSNQLCLVARANVVLKR
jgi:acyl dehydratase/GNAT superfamily N-acetyltransferase